MRAVLSLPLLACLLAAPVWFASATVEPGFESIFNGADFTGWRTVSGNPPKGVVVENGEIRFRENPEHVFTTTDYENFVFRFEVKIPPGGDSGISLRFPPDGNPALGKERYRPSKAAVEVQIRDAHDPEYKKRNRNERCGSVFQVLPIIAEPKLKPHGQWNAFEIRVHDSRISVTINNTMILNGDLTRSASHASRTDRNYNLLPGVGAARARGRIGIVNAAPGFAFRNLRVNPLPPGRPTTTGNPLPADFTAIFNDKDLAGWHGQLLTPYDDPRKRHTLDEPFIEQMIEYANSKAGNWTIADGILQCTRDGRGITTSKEYADFDLQLEYRLSPGADAGILLRETQQLQLWDADDPGLARYGANQGSGGLWFSPIADDRFPLVRADKPAGEWNHLYVRMLRDRVTVWLNGSLVLNDARVRDHWNHRRNVVRQGAIVLLPAANPIAFRNLHVREFKP